MTSPTIGRYVHESTPHWPPAPAAPPTAPNVVYIVLDDVGFSDLGCFGSEIDTTHMDSLAASGLRFNNFHTTSLCSPTRAALLTGRNHHAVGMGIVSNWDTGFPGYRGCIAKSSGSLAEMLRANGYNTFAVGKWHLAPTDDITPVGPYDHWPLQRGFDRYYGFLDGATDQWAPDLVADNHPIDPPGTPGYHVSVDLADQAIGMIRDHRSVYPEKPFFLYLAFGAGHYPLQAPRNYIDRYKGRYDEGWDALRVERLARQKQIGIVPADTDLAPRNADVRAWDELSMAERHVAARLMEAYAGFLDHADDQIGRVLAALDQLGARDNTIVCLLSDNGASGEGGPHGSLNYMAYVNGVPAPPATELIERLDEIGGPTTSPMYATGWAMASNTPLKRYKQFTHSGGIRDPFIVSWPARLGAHAGQIRAQYHHVTDVTPTVLDLIGLQAPSDINGVAQQPLTGTSMVSSLSSAAAPAAKPAQYYEMMGHRAIWQGGWKAVSAHTKGSDFEHDVWELYHLDRDFSEVNDLAATEPTKLQELIELWWREAEANDALPLDDRIMERFLVPKPKPITTRNRFIYYQGLRVPSYGAPDIKNVSYAIDAYVDIGDLDAAGGAADGSLIASGDRFSGYALFVRGGCAVFDYNFVGTHYVSRSAATLRPGPNHIRYEFTKTGEHRGTGTISINGGGAHTIELTQTLAMHISPSGLTVGWAPLSPVSEEYEAPFHFPGTIERVEFTLDRELGPTGAMPLD